MLPQSTLPWFFIHPFTIASKRQYVAAAIQDASSTTRSNLRLSVLSRGHFRHVDSWSQLNHQPFDLPPEPQPPLSRRRRTLLIPWWEYLVQEMNWIQMLELLIFVSSVVRCCAFFFVWLFDFFQRRPSLTGTIRLVPPLSRWPAPRPALFISQHSSASKKITSRVGNRESLGNQK